MDGGAPTSSQKFTFKLECLSAPDAATMFGTKTTTNNLGKVSFEDIESYLLDGDYIYQVSESGLDSSYNPNNQVFYARIHVRSSTSQNATTYTAETPVWYETYTNGQLSNQVSGIPTFANTTKTEVRVGGFSVKKALAGVEADDFAADATFSVTATWTTPEGSSVKSSSKTFKLSPDGTVQNGPQDLPVGTTVTFSEATEGVAIPTGYKLQSMSFEPKTVTISEGAIPTVTVTNVYEQVTPVELTTCRGDRDHDVHHARRRDIAHRFRTGICILPTQ